MNTTDYKVIKLQHCRSTNNMGHRCNVRAQLIKKPGFTPVIMIQKLTLATDQFEVYHNADNTVLLRFSKGKDKKPYRIYRELIALKIHTYFDFAQQMSSIYQNHPEMFADIPNIGEEEFDLKFCETCIQMTNHYKATGQCAKCQGGGKPSVEDYLKK